VISVAKSLALSKIVGIKSANGCEFLIHRFVFISFVVFPKSAVSHLLRMRAKFLSLLVCSKITFDNSVSVSLSFLRATTLSYKDSFCWIISKFLVWTAKYVWAKAISDLRGSQFWAIR